MPSKSLHSVSSSKEQIDSEDKLKDSLKEKAKPIKETLARSSKKKAVAAKKQKSVKKVQKKKKDPNAPKGAKSGYIFYSTETRVIVKQKHPDYSLGQTSKSIGKKWGKLTDEQKAPWNKKAAEDKIRYLAEMEAYNNAGESGNQKKSAGKDIEEEAKPDDDAERCSEDEKESPMEE